MVVLPLGIFVFQKKNQAHNTAYKNTSATICLIFPRRFNNLHDISRPACVNKHQNV